MAISHLCLDCGFDLARIRARREPRYGLPLVRCPDCGRAAVRRRHPLSRLWRQTLRLDAALTAVFLQLVALAAFATLTTLGALALGQVLFDAGRDAEIDAYRWLVIATCGVALPLATGAWLAAACSHWRRWWPFLAWGIVAMLPVTLAAALVAHADLHLVLIQEDLPTHQRYPDLYRALALARWRQTVIALLAMLAVATLGAPLGRGLLNIPIAFRRWRWRWRRRRRREGKIIL